MSEETVVTVETADKQEETPPEKSAVEAGVEIAETIIDAAKEIAREDGNDKAELNALRAELERVGNASAESHRSIMAAITGVADAIGQLPSLIATAMAVAAASAVAQVEDNEEDGAEEIETPAAPAASDTEAPERRRAKRKLI
jgi:hypothetical protein